MAENETLIADLELLERSLLSYEGEGPNHHKSFDRIRAFVLDALGEIPECICSMTSAWEGPGHVVGCTDPECHGCTHRCPVHGDAEPPPNGAGKPISAMGRSELEAALRAKRSKK